MRSKIRRARYRELWPESYGRRRRAMADARWKREKGREKTDRGGEEAAQCDVTEESYGGRTMRSKISSRFFFVRVSHLLHCAILLYMTSAAMSTTPRNSGAHILVYPIPAPGHIISLLDLTRLLVTHGLTITVLVSPSHLPLLQPILSSHLSSFIQPLVLLLPHSFTSSQSSLLGKIRATGELCDHILQWFRFHPSLPVAIVSDFFLGWTHRLATHLSMPRLAFWPSSAFTASILDSLWRGLPKNNDLNNENFLISFLEIPNSPIYHWWQITPYYHDFKERDLELSSSEMGCWLIMRVGVSCSTRSLS
ncbi:hypothetical protein HYC85_030066 [Camellia sinensis]|uniref:UDP-glycosyltransferase n=1 Tax=Camellia sinensis TaxID=4442 RepID=A0A7J7G0G8_CAMSI|nr:hypothetical protein HYC85_030066 [Camellia sinensis]